MIFSLGALLTACKSEEPQEEPEYEPENGPERPTDPVVPDYTIVVPAYKDYGRGTVDFSNLTYTRPDVAGICALFDSCTEAIEENAISYEEQLGLILALEDEYNSTVSMNQLCYIRYSQNTQNSYWAAEYEYMSQSYPTFSGAVEDLMVAAARSPHNESFEVDYFGEGLISEYGGGGVYSDDVILLMKEEAALEAEYSSLSQETVEITYNGKTATFKAFIDELSAKYSKTSQDYISRYYIYEQLYSLKKKEISKGLMIELFKKRAAIAEEMGLDSYTEFAYDAMGHDYQVKEILDFLDGICNYVYPTYVKLEGVFENYFSTHNTFTLNDVGLMNTLYLVYRDMDEDIFDVYCYMLQHGLYNVAEKKDTRFAGAYTTYINSNESPYVFMTSTGKAQDFLTMSHEFGHFLDCYVNYNTETSKDLAEVSSQALEFITLLSLKSQVSEECFLYLMYYELEAVLNELINQAFIALFEHAAYSLSSEMINEQSLEACAIEALKKITGSNSITGYDISNLAITHTMLYPFYVQSYCTSMIPSLEIFIKEYNEAGEGLKIYKDLVSREREDMSFVENLTISGLSSPFKKDILRDLMDTFYEIAVGCENYFDVKNENAA
jgi:hypothetical protein